jgi:ABC-type transporter Mla subunit MlaD
MKSTNWSQYIIAVIVIICSLVLLGALTFSLSGFTWKKSGRYLEIEFSDATGIKLHSAVRYAGAVAGSVTAMRYLAPEERLRAREQKNAVRVTVQLEDKVPPLPANVSASLISETILGEKFISLSAGDPKAPPLPNGAMIQGQALTAFDGLASSAQSAIDNANALLGKLNSDYPELVPRLASLLSQGNSLLSQSSNLVNNADGAITNANEVLSRVKLDYAELIPKLNSLLTQGKGIATNADLAVKQVGEFIGRAELLIKNNESDLGKILSELRVVSQNLKIISTYTKALTATLAEKPSRLIWSREKNALPTEREILDSPEPVPISK